MTIQEKAIEQLERVSRHLAAIGEKEDYTGVAIQALEQECEDAVSRRAVLDIVRFEENWLSDAKSNNADTDIAFSGIRTQVAKLSPVTSARKKGKWINKSHNNGCGITFDISECTGCGKSTFFDCDELRYRYCPNCGAKMDEDERTLKYADQDTMMPAT